MTVATVLPVVVLAVGVVAIARKVHSRRRAASVKVSGGRKALVLNLFRR